MRSIQSACLALLVTLAGFKAFALEIPELNRPVLDQAGVLDGVSVDRIEAILRRMKASSEIQGGVWILKSLDGESIEELSIHAAEKWKLGDKKSAKGFLLVIAMQEHKMRIEVGQGLEGVLTDLQSNEIISKIIGPRFRSGDYGMGIEKGIETIQKFASGSGEVIVESKESRRSKPSMQTWLYLFGMFVFMRFLFGRNPVRSTGFGSRGWSRYDSTSSWGGGSFGGGSSGGGGWSGGGGGFSGGGSSGSW